MCCCKLWLILEDYRHIWVRATAQCDVDARRFVGGRSHCITGFWVCMHANMDGGVSSVSVTLGKRRTIACTQECPF
jgi:hypothetical protein